MSYMGSPVGSERHAQLMSRAFSTFMHNLEVNGHAARFEYVSGFEGSESRVVLRCRLCGHELTRSAQAARKTKRITCEACEEGRMRVRDQQIEARREQRKAATQERILARHEAREARRRPCVICGESFIPRTHGQVTCGDSCRRRYRNRYQDLYKRAKLRGIQDYDTSITLEALVVRDNGRCHICGGLVDTADSMTSLEGYFIVGPDYPSIDHVFPVALGGQHTWENVKLAHHLCNSIKNDSVMSPR